LQIHPVLLEPAGETLTQAEYERIARQFHSKVRDLYGATECPFLSSDCAYGWYHVNSDWVVVEPVDADYQPTPPGEQSHTVLISNLANRVQPILRYDLGDSILLRPDPCPCGSPLPAIHVQGRAANVLTFPTERGEQVSIVPLAFDTLLARIRGIELFQIVQTTPTTLQVRLKTATGSDPDRVWQAVHTEMAHLLTSYHLDHVTLEHAEEAPEQSPGGKYRTILPLSRLG
jgi:phenylacetate-CoA ligase